MTKIKIGFSPCPNDTFIFSALINNKIDTGAIDFIPIIEDVEQLNNRVKKKEITVTKLSYATFANVLDNYYLLDSGGALGKGCGPLLIKKNKIPKIPTIAIPGVNTTAFVLLKYYYQEDFKISEMLFSEIEDAVLSGKADMGLIIHENRFTFQQRGLEKVADLGDFWKKKTQQLIPLGGVAVKSSTPKEIIFSINKLINKSIKYAFEHSEETFEYVKKNAQSLDDKIIREHIKLYVNEYSLSLGDEGRKSVDYFINFLVQQKKIQKPLASFYASDYFSNFKNKK